jgi:hypothetical protein
VIWLLRLYPSPWRRRYGGEVAEMLAHRGFSLAIAVDLVAGAIDVWLHPAILNHRLEGGSAMAAASAAESKAEEKTMLNRIASLDCSAMLGGTTTKEEQWKSAGVAVGGTLVLTLIWMAAHIRIGDNMYVDSLSFMTFIIPILFSMRYTYLKKRPASVQALFIGGFTLLLTAFFLGAGWIAGKI